MASVAQRYCVTELGRRAEPLSERVCLRLYAAQPGPGQIRELSAHFLRVKGFAVHHQVTAETF